MKHKKPKVSIIIPVTYLPIIPYEIFLKKILRLFLHKKDYEILIVDNSNYPIILCNLLKELEKEGCKILPYPYKFRYPCIYNYATKFASGEYLVFLDNFVVFSENSLPIIDFLLRNFKENVGVVIPSLRPIILNEKIIITFISFLNYLYKILKPLKFFYYFVKQRKEKKIKKIPTLNNDNNGKILFLLLDFYRIYYFLLNLFRNKQKGLFDKYLPELSSLNNRIENFGIFIVKKELFNEIGGFDENYYNFYYQYDFLINIKQKGYKIIVDDKVKILYIESFNLGLFKYNKFPKVYDQENFFKKLTNRAFYKPDNTKQILIIKLMTMGDVIMCTPVIKAIKEKFPEYKISLISLNPWAEILQKNPYIDNLIIINNLSHLPNYKIYDLITEKFLKKYKWEKIFQLNCLDHYPEYRRTSLHLSDFYASMANVYPLRDTKYYIEIEYDHIKRIKDILNSLGVDKNFITIHTNGGWELKNWQDDKWMKLSEEVFRRYGYYSVLIGASGEGKKIKSHYIFNLAGKLSIKETAALIKESIIFVGLDSGPMHLACAVNKPVVALFGVTHPKVGEPRCDNYICIHSRASCEIPCGLRFCVKKIKCTSYISVDSVLKAIDKLIKEKNIREIWLEDKPAEVFFKDWEWHILEKNNYL